MLRGKARQFARAGGALQSALGRLGLTGRLREYQAMQAWPDVVGAQIAAATRPLYVRDKVLFVAAKSSAWAHELIFRKAALLDALIKAVGRGVISDIRFQGTGFTETEARKEEEDPLPGPEEWKSVELTVDEKQAVERVTAGVADADLKARVERVMLDSLRVQRWKEERGWQTCVKCGLPHQGEGEWCTMCRPPVKRQ